MATNSYLFRRPSDRALFVTAAIGFPLLVLIGYARTYYFAAYFNARPPASTLVHAHAVVMTVWVAYFSAQIALVRSRSIRLHRALGMAGVALAALVFVCGMAVAIDKHLVQRSAPKGVSPEGFFAIPLAEMLLFALCFGGAIYYRRRPAEHKTLMLMTAINFLTPALARIPLLPPGMKIAQSFGIPALLALACFGWHTWKHRRPNGIFAAAVLIQLASYPLVIFLARNGTWVALVGRLMLAAGMGT
jgi:hypothetical protein